WPDRHNQITRQLARLLSAADDDALQPGRFATATVALQGLPALERLLFAQSSPLGAYGCRLASTIAANLGTIAGEVVDQWRGIAPDQDLAEGLVDGLMTQLQIIVDLKLLRPLGEGAASARPRL